MTDHEQEGFEGQLRQLKPGKLPEDLVARIQTAVASVATPAGAAPRLTSNSPSFFQIFRWLIPATAAFLVTAVIWRGQLDSSKSATSQANIVSLKADNVQIGKELVSSFDAVATLPSGEPVRFRCQQWMNKVVVDDEKQGLLVESRMPLVVVVPVGFESY